MENKFIVFLTVVAVSVVLAVCLFFACNKNINILNIFFQNTEQKQLSPAEIMEIIKTDKDYNELLTFIGNFDPEIIEYKKLGPDEYKSIKDNWQKEQLNERIALVDKISLTDSTYWVELKNLNDKTKGLRMVIDTKEKKSFLLIAAMFVSADVGI